MSASPQEAARLRKAVAALQAGEEPPREVDQLWEEAVRWTLDGWAEGIERDLRRVEKSLTSAAEAEGHSPNDDQVAALEECLWRLAAAVDKIDALISIAFGGQPLTLVADDPRKLTMRPSRDRNRSALQELGTPAALRLVEARAALSGDRARLRRHQIAHSLPPIDRLTDLALFIRVHHRDGRILGYELVRWAPERWDEGVTQLTPEVLFARRLYEVRRGCDAVVRVITALADALIDDPTARLPQFVYYDHDTEANALELPAPTGPPRSLEIDFVLEGAGPSRSRRVSSPTMMHPGIEITFDDGLWRVIRVEPGNEHSDQVAICRLLEGED